MAALQARFEGDSLRVPEIRAVVHRLPDPAITIPSGAKLGGHGTADLVRFAAKHKLLS